MKNIILVCAAGLSTSLLVTKMKSAAREEEKEVHIEAMSASSFAKYNGSVDVLLLGPQVRYMEAEMKSTYEPKGIQVAVIDMADYGMMNGRKVLQSAYAMMGE